jgi:nicotinate-nucleotide adenylyltransferase
MMRIGIFGGTFDPVHMGHLRAAEEIRENQSLDRVYLVPAYIPPHKRSKRITDPGIRLRMLKAAIRGNRRLSVSEIEINNGGVSYSINTVKAFQKRQEELYFILGVDAFAEIATWHSYQEIFYHTNFIIMERPNNEKVSPKGLFPADVEEKIRKVGRDTFEHISGKRIQVQVVTQLDISSTKIRESVNKGKSIKYLVPQQVERIIDETGLYRGSLKRKTESVRHYLSHA